MNRELHVKKELKAFAAPNVHETVVKLLADEKRGKMLDVGAGEGALTSIFSKMGFSLHACDLNREGFKLAEIEFKVADLNSSLPYPDDFFDFCLSVEIIEHLHDPWHLVSELARILKPNAKLVLTTPNIHSILSRMRFSLYGEISYFLYKEFAGEKENNLQDFGMQHINPIYFPELALILRRNNLEIETLATNMYTHKEVSAKGVLSRLTYPFAKTLMLKHFGRNSLYSSDELLCGDILILKAMKL